MSDLAFADRILGGARDFLDRHVGIDAMLIEVRGLDYFCGGLMSPRSTSSTQCGASSRVSWPTTRAL